jgi:hypothetical protein
MPARPLVVVFATTREAAPILRPLILLALLACCPAGASTVAAQTLPDPARTPPAREDAIKHPMVFFDAHGGPNACGPGCSEWIAAEGEIDQGSARAEGPAGDVTLAMDGFSAAYAKLQKACAQGVDAAPAAPFAQGANAPPPLAIMH